MAPPEVAGAVDRPGGSTSCVQHPDDHAGSPMSRSRVRLRALKFAHPTTQLRFTTDFSPKRGRGF
eukprot:scaffold90988_cov65-Phaeocystis_antarctica.AAC.1